MKVTSRSLLYRLNKSGLWRNPLRLQILSSELGISTIALRRRMRRRGIIRGPYVIDDRERGVIPVSKRSALIKRYAKLKGHPRSKVKRIAKQLDLTEGQVRSKLEASCGAQWYRREFDSASYKERAKLVKLLNRNGRWKSGGVVKAVAKEL